MLERFANDNDMHVLVIAETNITKRDLEKAKIAKFAIVNHSCRQDRSVKGGGGGAGGVLI